MESDSIGQNQHKLRSHKTTKRKSARPKAALTAIPDDWFPDAAGKKYAIERGVPQTEVERFRNHHQAKGTLSASWPASWRTWCNNHQRFNPTPPQTKSAMAEFRPSFGF